MSAITASISQGSSIGPPSYVVKYGDLKPITPGNQMVKFADDTDRQQSVCHAGMQSAQEYIKFRVLQGSVLGPC